MRRWRTGAVALVCGLVITLGGAAYWRFGRILDVPVATAALGVITARVVGPGSVQARVPVC